VTAPLKLTRERLIAEAAYLFARHGYGGTSTEMIIHELGVSRPTLYAHVRSKEGLLQLVCEEAMAFFEVELVKHVRPADPPLTRMRGIIMLNLEGITKLRYSIQVVLATQATARRNPRNLDFWHRTDLMLLQAIRDAIASGAFSAAIDPTLVKHTFWAVINDLVWWYDPEGRLTKEEVADQVLLMLSGGCAAPVSPRPAPTEGSAS